MSPIGPTALGHVVHDETLVKWFLDCGADPNGGYKYETAFSDAVSSGSIEVIKMFLEHGADVHRGDVMFFATGPKRAVEVTRVLLCKGADPNRLRFDGLEPG